MMTSVDYLIKSDSLKFHTSLENFNNTSKTKLIFQRTINLVNFLTNRGLSNDKGDEEPDIENQIVIKRGIPLNKQELDNYNKQNVQLSDLTDFQFRTACEKASETCHDFAKLFIFMELITKGIDLLFLVILPMAEFLEFSRLAFILCVAILSPVILIQVTTDWGKLLEKYSRLRYEFSELANSREPNRVKEFEQLVNHYRSSWIYADLLYEEKINR